MKKEKTKVKEVKNLGKNKKNKGITLIALVVTIIVLLILAGVAINLTIGQNGIFTKAQEAAIVTAVASVKEEIELEKGGKLIGNETLTPEDMVSEGKANRMVQEGEDGAYQMYYAIKAGAYKGMQNFGKGEISSLKDVFLIDDSLHVKYISSDGKEYGDELEEKILNDDTEITFASKEFEDYIKKEAGVTDGKLKFEWMKNLTSLTIKNIDITSLEDLVFFPNLITLKISFCKNIQELKGIENCSKLEEFYANDSVIKDCSDLSKISSLKTFSTNATTIDFDNVIDSLKSISNLNYFSVASANQIKSIKKLSELTTNLTTIRIVGCGINKIEGLENKINLVEADFSNNNISKIEGLSSCVKLNKLSLQNNNITKIEGLDKLENLKELYIANNQLNDILELDKNVNLIKLDIQKNSEIRSNREDYTEEENKRLDKIQEILTIRNGDIRVDIDKLGLFKGYKTLALNNQGITNLEFLKGQTNLTSLDLTNNNITLEDEESQEILKSMKNLTSLSISNNPLKTLSPINELTKLTSLSITGIPNDNDLSQIENVISNVSIFGLNQELINTIVNCDENAITRIRLDRRYV